MERKSNAKADEWYPLGTIAHVEENKTTLNAALKKLLNIKNEDIQEDKKKIKDCIENSTKKRSYSYVDCTDRAYITALLLKSSQQDLAPLDLISEEECWAKTLKDIQIEDINKTKTNNKLVLSPKQYGQRLKKKGR